LSSSSKTASPRRINGHVIWRRLGAPQSFHTLRKAFQACWAGVHSMRQCWAGSESPWSQPLQVAGIPMIWSQMPTNSPLLRISQVSAPTLRGRALCHILAMTWATVELWRFNCWTKVMMLGVCCFLLAFRYPLLAEKPKKGASPMLPVCCQYHSPESHGSSEMKPDSKIQYIGGLFPGGGTSLASLNVVPWPS